MKNTSFVFLSLVLGLAACAAPSTASPAPPVTATMPRVALPTLTVPPEPIATATQLVEGDLFSKVSRSTTVLHLRCDPLEIIFDVTVKDPNVKGVVFFFRMKDKATGLVNGWSNGENMRAVGNNMYEFNFRAKAIPNEARYYKDAWVQYQFVGIDQAKQSLGRTQIFSQEITYTPDCP